VQVQGPGEEDAAYYSGWRSELRSDEFDRIVRVAIEGMPKELKERLENLDVVVYDSRNRRAPKNKEWEEAEKECYGLIEGRHYGETAQDPGSEADLMPTRIILFQKTIEEDFDTHPEVVKCIQDTILHEIGHWFGEDEDDLDRLGLG